MSADLLLLLFFFYFFISQGCRHSLSEVSVSQPIICPDLCLSVKSLQGQYLVTFFLFKRRRSDAIRAAIKSLFSAHLLVWKTEQRRICKWEPSTVRSSASKHPRQNLNYERQESGSDVQPMGGRRGWDSPFLNFLFGFCFSISESKTERGESWLIYFPLKLRINSPFIPPSQ